MNKKQITKKYNDIVKIYENEDINLTNKINCYRCPKCKHITKTKDIDKGVTPAFFQCEKCNELASTTFYNDIIPNKEPTFEWFRPPLKVVLKMKEDGLLDHILQGGLDYRKI